MDFLASAKTPPLQSQYDALLEQHENLKKKYVSLSETVKVLGSQPVTPKLQEQYKALKDKVETLNRACESSDEKLFLQKQMHENKLRTIEAAHNTLKERCKAMAVTTEQHRLSNLQLEVRNKSMTKDVENLAGMHTAKEREVKSLKSNIQSNISTHQKELDFIKSEYTALLKIRESEIMSLKAKLESHALEAKRLQSKIQATETLLRSHPIDTGEKTKNILTSSAEILQLAHTNGSTDSMRQCLGQVAEVLKDLNTQLGSQRRLAKAWIDQVASV
jgi:chromosome segregation ATPase